MNSFIHEIIEDLNRSGKPITDFVFILPSQRAKGKLIETISKNLDAPIFAPKLFSIEEFLENVSQLKVVSNINVVFRFYKIYKSQTKNPLDFNAFQKWAQIVLQDFNEIDRHLVNRSSIFSYLGSIKQLERWSPNQKETTIISRYLTLWQRLETYYTTLIENLLNSSEAYQGLLYRQASENITDYIQSTNKTHIFIGFNALNTSEEHIIKSFLESGKGDVYWDIDSSFIDRTYHSAGAFIRQYKTKWKYYNPHPFKWIKNNYEMPKTMAFYGTPKIVGQTKQIGQLLKSAYKLNKLKSTAVILADENQLIPLLNALPKEIKSINITMGLPLKSMPVFGFFINLIELHTKLNSENRYYYKDLEQLLNHNAIQFVLSNFQKTILQHIQLNNLSYLKTDTLMGLAASANQRDFLKLLFTPWENDVTKALESLKKILLKLKSNFKEQKSLEAKITTEALYKLFTISNEIQMLQNTHNVIDNIVALQAVFKDMVSMETLDFIGQPHSGLQIMGMLESRVLDFETVIISGVNEGILPAGKSQNSFIPFDVKLAYNLPTYNHKDAVFTYHFYRLIQRAKTVHLIYNTELNSLTGGEPSRLITQLEQENIHTIQHQILSPNTKPQNPLQKSVAKTNVLIDELKIEAQRGFSPSSLSNYLRNPLDFYYQRILKLNSYEEMEETIAANTLGSVIHHVLEDIYSPFVNKTLEVNTLKAAKKNIKPLVNKHFKTYFKEGDISTGKNLIAYEVAIQYIRNLIKSDLKIMSEGNTLRLLGIENNYTIPLLIPGFDFPVNLKGKVDRIDELNGTKRIIDYKTGKTIQSNLNLSNWDELTESYKYHKSFQVLCYTLMLKTSGEFEPPMQAGILSFKNLSTGFMLFTDKTNGNTNHFITEQTLEHFKTELFNLIKEIFSLEKAFEEKKP